MRVLRVGLALALVFGSSLVLAQGGGDKRRSGYQDMGPALQKMQDDDTANPAMLFVQLGEQGWARQPIAPSDDPRLGAFREQGAAIYRLRQGQLNLSCALCHDDNAGKKLAGVTIPEGHPTAYPIYRLEWQALGSLKRRLRNCLVGIRAEPYAADAPDYVMLELFLMDRARGMALEAPGVRP